MKNIVYVLLILCGQNCYSQEIKENFINKIVHTRSFLTLDSLPGYYYLLQTTGKMDTRLLKWEKGNLNKIIPKKITEELVQKAIADSIPEKWNCNVLIGVKCVVDTFVLLEGQPYYSFSKPIFDSSFKYALIQVKGGYSQSGIGGYSLWLFRKNNDGWENIFVSDPEEY